MAHDLASLITVVDVIIHNSTDQEDQILDDHKKAVLKSLLEMATSLKNLLEKLHHLRGNKYKDIIEALQIEIRNAAHEAEDIVESHAVDQMLSEPEASRFLIEKFEPANDKLMNIVKKLLESILEKATSLMNIFVKSVTQIRLRGNGDSNSGITEASQSEIRDAAHEAEDITEPEASRFLISPPGQPLDKVMQKFDAAKEKMMKIIKDDQSHDEEEAMNAIINPFFSLAKPNIDAMVGFEEDTLHLKHRLTNNQRSGREIIPIVGMGGIGKTTLARSLYNDLLIVSHFDVRAWVTVPQEYNVRAIILGLLGCLLEKISDNVLRLNDSGLGLTLYQMLCGRRYLVVLDDIWSKNVWDEIRSCFPNQNNGSRFMITSRELDVAKYPDSACKEHQMHLLSHTQSWDLLRQKVFDAKKEERCPPFLEEVGHKIVGDCGGLPLAISVIGGLLSANKYSKDLWEQVSRDVRSVLSDRDEDFSKILCLSYDNLPLHLKPCFLYMAAFPEDFKVRGSKLVKLWIAEGFLWSPSGNNKSWEEVADEYLKALVDRNLISVTSTKPNGRPESYSMHDLLRDLCVRKADEEKFLHVVKNDNVCSFRRVSVHPAFTGGVSWPELRKSGSRSLLCINRHSCRNISHILSTSRLVRVLYACDRWFGDFPSEKLQLFNLRFLAVKLEGSLPSGIWRLRNLQTLIIITVKDVRLPHEAWEISGLRHIKVRGTAILIDFKIPRVHENVQTILNVHFRGLLASNLIHSIPNVRKLGIDSSGYYTENSIIIGLSHLHKLETLTLEFFVSPIGVLFPRFILPSCLKKLTLYYCCQLPMRLVNDVVGALEHLQVLKIRFCQFQLWEVNEGVEFCSLQFLELYYLDIVCWKADDSSHFPRLRHLRIGFCKSLDEIPKCIGEIETLEMIEVDYCLPSLVSSAKEIQETQRCEYGNESLQIRIRSEE